MPGPDLLALDFDGVLCDGLPEQFQTAWQAYCRLWQPREATPPQALASQFDRLRPVVAVGWEMPVLLAALQAGVPEARIWQDWPGVAREVMAAQQLDGAIVARVLDAVRDEQIATDPAAWLDQHRFYPGVVGRLQALLAAPGLTVLVVTTKEERFARRLLQQAGVSFPAGAIWGKECQQPKTETLRQLLAQHQPAALWFVEDRLETLQSVQQQLDAPNLRLFLAQWGYNTERARAQAQAEPGIQPLSLECFLADCAHWLPAR